MGKFLIIIALLSFFSNTFLGQTPVGIWVTVDDETGKEKSQVEIYEKDQKLFGKIIKLLMKPQNTICEVCEGERKNKPLVGMIIISHMKKKGAKWEDGKIYKADAGKEYNGFLKMKGPDKLIVTGKVLFITKSQTWKRLK